MGLSAFLAVLVHLGLTKMAVKQGLIIIKVYLILFTNEEVIVLSSESEIDKKNIVSHTHLK